MFVIFNNANPVRSEIMVWDITRLVIHGCLNFPVTRLQLVTGKFILAFMTWRVIFHTVISSSQDWHISHYNIGEEIIEHRGASLWWQIVKKSVLSFHKCIYLFTLLSDIFMLLGQTPSGKYLPQVFYDLCTYISFFHDPTFF